MLYPVSSVVIQHGSIAAGIYLCAREGRGSFSALEHCLWKGLGFPVLVRRQKQSFHEIRHPGMLMNNSVVSLLASVLMHSRV
jgi:hypothetical protein